MCAMFPLAAKGSMEKKDQLPWKAVEPYKGLGWRSLSISGGRTQYIERPLAKV